METEKKSPTPARIEFEIFITAFQHYILHLKPLCVLNSAEPPNFTGYPFTDYYRSVGRATVICFGGRGCEYRRGQRFFLFLRVGPFPF